MVDRSDHEALELELSDEKQKYRNMEKQKGLMEGLCAKQQSYIEELREMLKKRGLKQYCQSEGCKELQKELQQMEYSMLF